MNEKTVVIFNNFDEGAATCVVMDGDFTHLNNQFVNGCDESIANKIDILVTAVSEKYNIDNWYVGNLPKFPSDEFYEAVKGGAKVIITGCLP